MTNPKEIKPEDYTLSFKDNLEHLFFLVEKGEMKYDEATRAAFLSFFLDNIEVWRAFERFTLEAVRAGKNIGAKAIAERVRWEAEIERGADWKVNNNYVAYMARVFAYKYPQHSNFFEFREVHGLKQAA